ncbi:hypothetical protein R5W23_004789 [Gemmata sp. JC673]|uniref:Uncharacterized protein n=1 Tax=Gemmata algarum TaxID=2975278 RepID=A0ABU5F729_9BACT|nr:hypothetical protein [Gemmata algarum]MDY3563289.1 hypothetical protein [Gemmata algarum]
MPHAPARLTLISAALLALAAPAPAQVNEPPRPEKVKIEIRYRIRADRDERVRQYTDLQKFLAKLGFDDARKNEPDYDLEVFEPTAERMTGTIAGAKALSVLDNPRVQNVLFEPADFVRPDADKPVAVKLGLRGGYLPGTQQQLHRQTVEHLAQLGFVESLGYDTRGYTLVRGALPSKSVDVLVKDLRYEPSGWFAPRTRVAQLPAPLSDRNPIRWAEVLPHTEFAAPLAPPAVLPAQLKYSADLRAALLAPAAKGTQLRVEVVFRDRVEDLQPLKIALRGRYSGASVDGAIGNIVHVRLPRAELVELLAQEPGVIGLRLPRQGTETVTTGTGGKGEAVADALKASRLDELHKRGYTGAGVKVVLIGSDFTGAEQLIGTELPRRTKVLDLTTELAPDLIPFKSDPTRVGTGVPAAKALAAAAPDAELVLVRIDPGCYFHLNTVLKLTRGELEYTEALQSRLAELSSRLSAFEDDRDRAIAAYKTAFADLTDNEVAVAQRKKAKADLDAVLARERELTVLSGRLTGYQKDITRTLAGAQVIVNTLVWESGYPLDSVNEFARTIDARATGPAHRVVKGIPAKPAPHVWVQAASASGAAVWGGPFLDANRDGLMEFAPPKSKLPDHSWSAALNFLGTRAATGTVAPELAAGSKLRIVVQWREATNPNFPEADTPAQPLTLRLLRQIDPTGTKRSSDELAEEARSVSVPQVIYRTPTLLVFEQMLEFSVATPGRYALAVDSPGAPDALLPVLRREVEIYPRIAIDTVGAGVGDPKVVFRSFTSPTAGVGTPGDALGAITVGADVPGTLVGGGTGLTLRGKPDILGPGTLNFGPQAASGSGVATGFVGGATALMVQLGAAGPNVFSSTGIDGAKKIQLPPAWLNVLPQGPRVRQ